MVAGQPVSVQHPARTALARAVAGPGRRSPGAGTKVASGSRTATPRRRVAPPSSVSRERSSESASATRRSSGWEIRSPALLRLQQRYPGPLAKIHCTGEPVMAAKSRYGQTSAGSWDLSIAG